MKKNTENRETIAFKASADIAARVRKFRFSHEIDSLSEAMRRLLEAGLSQLEGQTRGDG